MQAFKDAGSEPEIDQTDRYAFLWSFYAGSWRSDPAIVKQRRSDPRIYQRSRLLWNLARSVTRLYAQAVYQGDLSTDGKPLPDGTGGAIPIDPQTGTEAGDDALRRACAELWSIWRWRQHMALGPKYAAILGDCLIELVDDLGRGVVEPKHVWPGYVTDIQIDLVGNVKRYTLEYLVTVPESRAYGKTTKADAYRFRKEVDGAAFRYYRDDHPAAFPELGIRNAEEPNPYGFAPAVWLRHEIVPGVRGLGAFEAAIQTEREINGLLSQALDYQRKQFAAPVGVKGGALRRGDVVAKPASADPWADADAAAQSLDLLPMTDAGEFVTVSFDIGQTVEMIGKLEDALVAEFPEARYGQQILEATQVTAPGAERMLGPIVGLVRAARASHDPQMVKLMQMPIAMTGQRLANGDYPGAIVDARRARYDAFRPFNLESYGRGGLDFSIPDREVIPQSQDERIDRLAKVELLQTPWALRQAGVDEADIAAILGERAARQDAMDAQLTGLGVEGDGDDEQEETP